MGVVYSARQDALDRTVAIKVVAEHLSADPEFLARFEREARAAGALNHPHIVAVHDAGEDAGRLYLTMQYVEGRDLSTMLRRHGPMPSRSPDRSAPRSMLRTRADWCIETSSRRTSW